MSDRVTALLSRVLKVSEDDVTDDLRYHSTTAWSSVAHVELMVRLEEETGVHIGSELVLRLTSVRAIRDFYEELDGKATPAAAVPPSTDEVRRGLAGVVFDHTVISEIDGVAGSLSYRGYSIHDLAQHATFDEVAHLLLYGALPSRAELAAFCERIGRARALAPEVVEILSLQRDASPMTALRTAVSALRRQPDVDEREQLIAQVPTIIATHAALCRGAAVPVPDAEPGIARSLLAMLGLPSDAERAGFLDQCLIVQAEHSSNASAFTARVVVSTEADRFAAITAAIAAFGGGLHGGAVEQVKAMIDEVGAPENAARYVADCRRNGNPVMGFGHRVYKTEDPRARHLRSAAAKLCESTGATRILTILDALCEAMAPLRRHGMDINVDFYSGAIYDQLGIAVDLFVPVFVAARVPGWLAQIDEQQANNVLIRPLLRYAGERERAFVPLLDR